MAKQKKIGILTSGGDAPGMNAAIRAVVRTGLNQGVRVVGIKRGFEGLLSADIIDMTARSVSDTIQRGGTILLTARCPEMMAEEGQKKAADICKILNFDALVVIGGDGSFKGAAALAKFGVNVIGIPATIDLDMACTDYTIGFDTAVNTGMESITKIRDTSSSHERCSIVEVMGRNAGHIALWCGMTGGAEETVIPEKGEISQDSIIERIIENRSKGKTHNLIIMAEGVGGSVKLAKEIEKATGIETRATILGHLQRGGSPTALDRMRASMMGYLAVKIIMEDHKNRTVVYKKGEYTHIDMTEALNTEKAYNDEMYQIVKILSV